VLAQLVDPAAAEKIVETLAGLVPSYRAGYTCTSFLLVLPTLPFTATSGGRDAVPDEMKPSLKKSYPVDMVIVHGESDATSR
jgi:hypothetical protein